MSPTVPSSSAPRTARRTLAAAAVLVAVLLTATACGAGPRARGGAGGGSGEPSATRGRVTVVYEDDTVAPEDRHAVAVVRRSRVLEEAAAWVDRSLALPHDLTVKVTGKVPPGVTDAVTQPDGRTIYLPPSFLTRIQDVSGDVVRTTRRPALIPAADFTADRMTALSTRFVLGHELGHALQRQLTLPNLGLEEDAADGFASFHTVNEGGPAPSLAAAMLFDELARKEGALTLEGFSSDHPVTQQRVFHFLCYLEGSDPKTFEQPLVGTGYLPKSRAPLCPQAWAMLDHGWWTQLAPHFSPGFRAQGDAAQRAAYDRLVRETKAFADKLDAYRRAQ
ncbi:DUF4344 domain-containing metallopeptidase [Streptomyces sp. WAC06614]|uniref:DUF4344 domain-containing metallopeptidase n=1 Tax=Streptomyces sp. WAC06614 TaxID=2487416 RepID=UPI0021AFF942|nr:DUF4344 domain-containing metallopeptidase [Streptomyces sp. WAC06614]